jgi:hypothetical protein
MTTRKRISDYPAVFWSAIIATIVGGAMSIAAYNAMMHSDSGLYRAIGIFVVLECVSIFAAATLNTKGNGLLVGFAAVLIVGCALTEIFLGASELQRGVMEMTETAKAATSSNSNATANAQALTAAQSGLSACQKRYPRKQRDEKARTECSKPYQATINNLTASAPSKAVEFDAEAAGMLALWQAVADTYNSMFKDSKVEAGQIAFTVMLFIFTVFVLGKLFLWSKYAAWVAQHYGEHDQQHVTIDESKLGEPDAMPQPQATEPEPRKPFGFSPSNPAPSSAAINRAKYMHVSTLEPIHAHVNKHAHVNIHAHVNKHAHVSEPLQAQDAYMHALNAKAGSIVGCPQCGTEFKKVNKQHTFCKPTCRDTWHNAQDPNRVQYLKNRKRKPQ